MVMIKNISKYTLYFLLIIGLVGLGWLGATLTLTNKAAEKGDYEKDYVAAINGEIRNEYNFGFTIETPLTTVAENLSIGIITQVGKTELSQGSMVYVVNNEPVFAVESKTPFWRDIELNQIGDDISAVQKMLKDRGYYAKDLNARFDWHTLVAWQKFQKDSGEPTVAEQIPLGKLIAFSKLPTVVEFTEQMRTGKKINGGEELIKVRSGKQKYYITASEKQLDLIPIGAQVEVEIEGQKVVGKIEKHTSLPNSETILADVVAADGSEICAEKCQTLPVKEKLNYAAKVSPTQPINGVLIPISSIETDPNNHTYVTDEKGIQHEVKILGTSQGMAAVEGIEVGTRIEYQIRKKTPDANNPKKH